MVNGIEVPRTVGLTEQRATLGAQCHRDNLRDLHGVCFMVCVGGMEM